MSNAHSNPAFESFRLAGLNLRNRFIKSATYEGMSPHGVPSPALTRHHRDIAAGGAALTTVAYCAVSPTGRTFAEQMYMRPDIVAPLRELTDAVHAEGGAASLQLGHCGFFTKNEELKPKLPLAPSRVFNAYGLTKGLLFSKEMDEDDMDAVANEFARSAQLAKEAGFDAIELHLGHGYLLSQFLSPWSNRRTDDYGGSLENRLRFPLRVYHQVRAAVGKDFPILCKINLTDGFKSGLQIDDAIGVARALEGAGVDALVLSGGFTSKNALFLLRGGRPLKQMIEVEKSPAQKLALRAFGPLFVKQFPFEEMFFLHLAKRIRLAVQMPLGLLGGIVSMDNITTAMDAGFDLVVLGRPLIYDPSFVNKLGNGEVTRSGCNQCNECIAEMDRNGVRCVLQPSQNPH